MRLPRPAAAEVVSAEPTRLRSPASVNLVVPPAQGLRRLRPGRPLVEQGTYLFRRCSRMTLQLRPGGCLCETLDDGGGVEHMRVAFVQPGERIVLTGSLGPLLYRGDQRGDGRQVRADRRRLAGHAELPRRRLRQGQWRQQWRRWSIRCLREQMKRFRAVRRRRRRSAIRSSADQRHRPPRRRCAGRQMILIGDFAPALARAQVGHDDVAVDLGDALRSARCWSAIGSNRSKIAAPPMTETARRRPASSALFDVVDDLDAVDDPVRIAGHDDVAAARQYARAGCRRSCGP